jgi:hypothetical protein
MNSNRGTYEKLEIDLTYTKHSPGLVSNRGNCQSFCSNLHFRTPLAASKFRVTLQRNSSHRKMQFFRRRHLIIPTKHNHIARSRDSQILIGQKTRSRESSSICKHNTYELLIGTEMRLFHSARTSGMARRRTDGEARHRERQRAAELGQGGQALRYKGNSRSLPAAGRPHTAPNQCIGAGGGCHKERVTCLFRSPWIR